MDFPRPITLLPNQKAPFTIVKMQVRQGTPDTVVVDCRRLLCPLPVIRVQDRVADLATGIQVEAVCTDSGALQDIPAWFRINGHTVLQTGSRDGEHFVVMRVGGVYE